MLEQDACLSNGLEVVRQCARWFYSTNASHYQAQGFDYCDIEGHLSAEVLMRYLDLVERQPDFYNKSKSKGEMESFRSSLYQSCRNACFAHHRKHIRSQKRGLNLRNGVIHLDHSDLNSDGIMASESLMVNKPIDYAAIYKPIADKLYRDGEYAAARLWCLIWHENKPISAMMMAELDNKEKVLAIIREQVIKFLPDSAPNLSPKTMDPALKERFRKASQNALKSGAMQVVEESNDAVSRLLVKVAEMSEAQAESALALITGGATPKVASKAGESIKENARRWLVIDYELVSDALDIEINPEMNPLVVKRILDSAMDRMDVAAKGELPDLVWDFIKSINEAFPNPAYRSDQVKVRELVGAVLSVEPPTTPLTFLTSIKESPRWMSWVDSNSVSFWVEDSLVKFESPNFLGADITFVEEVIKNLAE